MTEPARSRRSKSETLTTASIVSFSLTILAAGIGVVSGLVPLNLSLGERVDLGALLFVAPVLALVLAVCFEVSRIALLEARLPNPQPAPRRILTAREDQAQ